MSHLPLAEPPRPDESPEALRARVAALEARLAVLEPLLERFPGVIARFDPQLRHRFVSASVERATGLPAERFLGKTNRDLGMPEELVDQWDTALANVFATGQPVRIQFTFPTATGVQYYDAELVPEPGPDGAVTTVISVTRDVTEQKQLEAALRAQEAALAGERAFLDAVLEHMDEGVAVSDMQGQLRFANAALARITGYQRGGAVPQNLVTLLGGQRSEAAPGSDEPGLTVEPSLQNELRTFVHEDGTQRELLVSQQWLTRDGTPLLVTSLRDVTAQRAAEAAQRRLEQKLQETQRLESLGRLAGGIAHDFNNLLAVILGHADLLSIDLAPDAPGRANLSQIASAARQGADLARQMLIYAGRSRLMFERVNLNEVIRNDRLLLEASLGTDVRLQLALAHELPLLTVDLNQIRQVVMNLVANASDALGERGGIITITTELVIRREGERHDEDLPSGASVQLTVHDTGEGIEPMLLERVFEPFFSTRFIGRGLGLAVVRSIVERHGGRVFASSEPGRGTSVALVLPVLAAATERPAAMSPSRRGGVVLVVDDEERVQQVAGSMLERLGYTPVLAQDGAAALAEIQARGGEFTLVLLDLTMPGMRGDEVLKAIRAIAPDLPVVVMSGYSTREIAQKLTNQGVSGFLEKPFSLSALRARLRALEADPS